MTTPPHPPQGPYGPPPSPQYPAGPPPAPGFAPPQQPYGYPQQPPAPPQQGGGWAQQPPPGMPYGPGPGTPGGWPPYGAQPPRKKRTALIVGIVAGAVLVAGGIAYGVTQLVGKAADGRFPEARYRLVLEPKLLDGEFSLAQDLSATEGKKMEDAYDPGIRDAKAVVGQYGSAKGGVLVISGMYGRFADSGAIAGKMMKGASEGDGATVAIRPREFTPAGSDVPIECQVLRSVKDGIPVTFPMCAWGDDNTGVSVGIIRPETVRKAPNAVDLEAMAAETAQIREEMRQPIG
ncbi:hypothetical protein B7C62_25615 [Kitasatospora albolonga]|uniref:Uncharacterized protein n=1 Tax=Kitasatospora albolonga TaxID=68173 RepID=A0ABC8BXY2_9ACTN|nr:hypothetical protein B7C62_25615 [Kitasatospora albolonga]